MSGRHPRLSIGVPAYNSEAYLAEALDSLLAQTFDDFELIVSDNGSTDATCDIARRIAARDPRVRYHRHSQNVGLAANYNGLVRMASGELFKWAPADDVCQPTYLERCIDTLDATPDAVLAYPRTQFINRAGQPLPIEDPGFPLIWLSVAERWRYVVGAGHWVNAVLGVVRRAALLRTHLMPSYRGGDYALLGELCLLGRFVEVPETLFLRRLHPDSSSQIGTDEVRWQRFMTGRSQGVSWPEWHRLRDHLGAAMRADLPFSGRLGLLGAVVHQTWRRRQPLVREAAHMLRVVTRAR